MRPANATAAREDLDVRTHRKQLVRLTAVIALSALFATGCAGISHEARQLIQQPADCADAQANIDVLKENRAGAGKRVVQGFQGVLPPMVVLSVLRDTFIGKPFRSVYLDHWRIAFGSYNGRIDERVSELEACGGGM